MGDGSGEGLRLGSEGGRLLEGIPHENCSQGLTQVKALPPFLLTSAQTLAPQPTSPYSQAPATPTSGRCQGGAALPVTVACAGPVLQS